MIVKTHNDPYEIEQGVSDFMDLLKGCFFKIIRQWSQIAVFALKGKTRPSGPQFPKIAMRDQCGAAPSHNGAREELVPATGCLTICRRTQGIPPH